MEGINTIKQSLYSHHPWPVSLYSHHPYISLYSHLAGVRSVTGGSYLSAHGGFTVPVSNQAALQLATGLRIGHSLVHLVQIGAGHLVQDKTLKALLTG